MDNGKIVVTIHMGMCIHIRRTTVRRPTCMTDAEAAHGHIPLDLIAQCRKATDTLFDADVLTVIDGNPGRVIATILKLRESVKQELCRLTIPNITNDSTHKNTS